MAMGRRGRDDAERAIANCRPFQNSTGSMRGTRGATRDLGWLSSHREHAKIKELLSRATYVVWSYDTPIGCVTEDEDGNILKVYFDESHSATTSQHQGVLRVAFSDFESIGDGPWSRSQNRSSRPRRAPRVNRQDPLVPGMDCGSGRDPETERRASTAQMLDPRFRDPDWTPWMQPGTRTNLPPEADQRDYERVLSEGRRPVQ